MKINKKSSEFEKSAIDFFTLLAGGGLGLFASGMGYEALKNVADTKTVNLVKRAGIAGIGAGGAIAISGNDTMTNIVKGAGVGIALRQLFDGGKEAFASTPTAAKLVAGSKLQKSLAGGFGLSCPCNMEMQPLRRPAHNKHTNHKGMKGITVAAAGLNSPSLTVPSLDEAFAQGAMMVA